MDHARKQRAAKRGGGNLTLALDEAVAPPAKRAVDLIALDDALNAFAYELDARDDVHATARYRRDLVRMIGRDLVREVLQ